MRVLFISAVLPYPLHSGGQIRIYHLLRRLSARHEITLASYIRSEGERQCAKDLGFLKSIHMVMRGRAWQPGYMSRAVLGPYPFLLATYDNPAMRATVASLTRTTRYDLVHIEPFYVWPGLGQIRIPLVVAEHNIEYEVYAAYARRASVLLRPALLWDVAKLKRREQDVWRSAARVTAVSESDAGQIGTYLGHPADIVPNGVDTDAFRYTGRSLKGPLRMLFVGNFRWMPNVRALAALLRDIWPQVRLQLPGAELTLVGRDMPAHLRASARAAGVRVEENVADIRQSYGAAHVLVAPLAIAGGTKFKMLEAMSSGLPVVTTEEGMSGLDAEPGTHYRRAGTPQEFVRVLADISTRYADTAAMTMRARKLVETRYSWDHIAGRLEAVWKGARGKNT